MSRTDRFGPPHQGSEARIALAWQPNRSRRCNPVAVDRRRLGPCAAPAAAPINTSNRGGEDNEQRQRPAETMRGLWPGRRRTAVPAANGSDTGWGRAGRIPHPGEGPLPRSCSTRVCRRCQLANPSGERLPPPLSAEPAGAEKPRSAERPAPPRQAPAQAPGPGDPARQRSRWGARSGEGT